MLPLPEPYIKEAKTLDNFIYPRSKNYPLTESWDLGGVELNSNREEMTKYSWFAWTDGTTVFLKREDLTEVHTLFTDVDITEIDLTFDQNMNYCIAYVSNKLSKISMFSVVTQTREVSLLGDNVKHPRVSLDDKRSFNVNNSDIILSYQKGNKLYYLLQRERFLIEHLIAESSGSRFLWRVGMGKNNCFLFFWR